MTISEANGPVPDRIEAIIKERGLVKKFIADKAGIGSTALYDILSGRRIIRPCDMVRLADALGVGVDEFFERKEG